MKRIGHRWITIVAAPACALGLLISPGTAFGETITGMLAAQIRTQGFACDKALGATRDAKRSKPNHDVWVLRCSNAVYRVSRYPDMAATVVPLR